MARAAAYVSAIMCILLVVSCAPRESPSSPLGTAKASRSEGAIDRGNPGDVALRFTELVASGDFAGAQQFVVPSQRGVLDALALGADTDSQAKADVKLAVGEIRTSKGSATVSLVGTLCKPSTSPAGASMCVENRDPGTANPAFLVRLERGADERWYVRFGAEGGELSAQPTLPTAPPVGSSHVGG